MSWTHAHRYYEALRIAERDLDASADGLVVWRPEYADVFRSPGHLMFALRSRWENMVRAQIDSVWEIDGSPSARMRELVDAHPGLVRAVARSVLDEQKETPVQPDAPLAGVA
jgi:hypothetical protein